MSGSTNTIEAMTVPERVLCAVAEATDVSPMELSPPLYESINPDALESLVEGTSNESVCISFEYHDCAVTVCGNGDVSVSTPATDTDRSVTVTAPADCPEFGISAL
jgi:hypothetical protein